MKVFFLLFFILNSAFSFAESDPKDAYKLVEQGKAVMIDVREKDEIASGMVKNAIWFPKSKVASDSAWKKDFDAITKGKKIFLYCRSGRRSGEMKDILQGLGTSSENIGGYETLKNILPTSIPVEN